MPAVLQPDASAHTLHWQQSLMQGHRNQAYTAYRNVSVLLALSEIWKIREICSLYQEEPVSTGVVSPREQYRNGLIYSLQSAWAEATACLNITQSWCALAAYFLAPFLKSCCIDSSMRLTTLSAVTDVFCVAMLI